MSFRFKPAEPFARGFHRIAAEQIERALGELSGGGDRVKAVHETRKGLKRLRALLRLVRPAIGEQAFRAENVRLRDAGRLLSGARDQAVLLQTLAALSADTDGAELAAVNALHQVVASEPGRVDPQADETVANAVEMITAAGRDIAALEVPDAGFDVVAGGLQRSLESGRRAMLAARQEPTDEAIHEWRKSVQVHWRHMRLLGEAWPEYVGLRTDLARDLSQVLGEDHDLAVLIAHAEASVGRGFTGPRAAAVVALARARQAKLRRKAWQMGSLLFADSPKGLVKRMARYWRLAEKAAVARSKAKATRLPASEPDRPTEVPPAPRRRSSKVADTVTRPRTKATPPSKQAPVARQAAARNRSDTKRSAVVGKSPSRKPAGKSR